MKKRFILLLLSASFILPICFAQNEKREYKDSILNCFYETENGRINGTYFSYYRNGIKKAEGEFENNYRKGQWSVWDSTGRLRMQRFYENPFVFRRLIPKKSKDKPAILLDIPQYTLKYNNDNYIEYFPVEERMILFVKRLWRFIPQNGNPLLCDNKLFKIIQENIFNKSITAYDVSDDELFKVLPPDLIDTNNIELIGYKIKEDWFFDSERLVSESRIIGLCPVAMNTITNDTISLYWLWFPEIRKYLALVKITDSNLPSEINTLDDLFFFRYFNSSIYNVSNVYDRKIYEYKLGKEIEKGSDGIEISLIETEHDIWISLTK